MLVGAGLGKQAAVAVTHRNRCAGDRCAEIKPRYPGQGACRAPFEMHREVGDQGAGAHIHGPVFAEKGFAQTLAFRFQNVIAGLFQRQANHFKGLCAIRLGQAALPNVGDAAGEQAGAARIGLFGDIRDVGWVVELMQPGLPIKDAGIVGDAHPAQFCRTAAGLIRLQIAQRDRQQAAGDAFDDAEFAGEFDQRRQIGHLELQRETRSVDQCTPFVVHESARQAERESGVGREGAGEDDAVVHRFRVFRLLLRVGFAFDIFQRDAVEQVARHRGGEIEADGGERQAAGLGVFFLAAHACNEMVAHIEFQPLLGWVALARWRADSLTPDQRRLGVGRQGALAAQHFQARVFAGVLLIPVFTQLFELVFQLTQDTIALGTGQTHGGDLFVNALRFAMRTGDEACRLCRAIQQEHENLIFIQRRAWAGQAGQDARARNAEGVFGSGIDFFSGQRGHPGFEFEAAASASLRQCIEVIHPGAFIGPVAAAGDAAFHFERRRCVALPERCHRRRETRLRLANFELLALWAEVLDASRMRQCGDNQCRN